MTLGVCVFLLQKLLIGSSLVWTSVFLLVWQGGVQAGGLSSLQRKRKAWVLRARRTGQGSCFLRFPPGPPLGIQVAP